MNPPVRAAALVAVLVVALTGCSAEVGAGDKAVSAADVERQIQERFAEQFPVDSADCPESLEGTVGATTICTMVSQGESFEVTATVEAVDGDTVDFGLEVTKKL